MDLTKSALKGTLLQVCRFGIVGVTAASVHYFIVIFLVQNYAFNPLIANIFGFICAFQLSYWGHQQWTFADSAVIHREAMMKMLCLQLINFIINETLFSIFLVVGIPYQLALVIVLAVLPLATFIISRQWVFKSA